MNTFKEIKQEIYEKSKLDDEKILKIFSNLIDKSSVIINSVEKKEEITVVNTKIKAVDMGNYFVEIFIHIFPLSLTKNEKEIQDEMVKFFEELNERKDLKYIENDLIIELKKVDGKLTVTDDSKRKMKELMSGFYERDFSKINNK